MPEQERLLVPIPAACVALGNISRPTLYQKVDAGEITLVKIGRRSFIVATSLEQYVSRLSEAASA